MPRRKFRTVQENEIKKIYPSFQPAIETTGAGMDYGLMHGFCSNRNTNIIDLDTKVIDATGEVLHHGTLERNGRYFFQEVKSDGSALGWPNVGQARYWLPMARERNKWVLLVQSKMRPTGMNAFLFEPTRFAKVRTNFEPKDLVGGLDLDRENSLLEWHDTDVAGFKKLLSRWYALASSKPFWMP